MAIIFAFFILALAIISKNIGHSWLFPPAIYSLYWAVIVLISSTLDFRKYTLPTQAAWVFCVGCICFLVGGIIAKAIFDRKRSSRIQIEEKNRASIDIFIICFNIVLILLIPAFIVALREAGYSLGQGRFAVGARLALGQADRAGVSRIYLSLKSIAGFLAYYEAWMYRGTRRDKKALALAVGVPLAISFLTFARTSVYTLIIGVLAILIFRRKISTMKAVGLVGVALVVSLSMGALLDKNPALGKSKLPIIETLDSLAVYYVGGPLGFGQVMDNPTAVGETGLSLRFFTQALDSAGIKIYLPNNILGYFDYKLGNIYTAYFAYWLDWQWAGVVIYSILIGFISSLVYYYAYRKNIIAGAGLGLVYSSMLNSAVGDGLLYSSIPWILLIGIGCVIAFFRWPVMSSANRMKKLITFK